MKALLAEQTGTVWGGSGIAGRTPGVGTDM